MSARDVGRTIDAALAWLAARDAAESAVAAHELGRADSDADAGRWVRWLLDDERDGAWDDDLLATTSALLRIRELREAASLVEQDPAVGRALDWVRARRSVPGAWTDGCDPDRHRRARCHHFAAGFFSPGAPERSFDRAELIDGAPVAGDPEYRFAVSAEALRCTLRWREAGTDDRLHLGALRRVADAWFDDAPPGLTTTALLAALHALVASPDERDRAAAGRALERVAGLQRGDGSWVDADPFHAMAVFGAAADAGVGGARVRQSLDHGARLLVSAQRPDGSWGPEHGPRRALIALRTIRRSAA